MPNIECVDYVLNAQGKKRFGTATELCKEAFNLVLDYFQSIIDTAGTDDDNDVDDVKDAILALISSNAPSPTWLASKTAVVSAGTATSFVSVDCSLIVPVGTKAVILEVYMQLPSPLTVVPILYLRRDSVNGAVLTTRPYSQTSQGGWSRWLVIVSLDTDRTFDYKIDQDGQTGTCTLSIVGYM